jgi:hypothetical protein
MLGYFAGNPQHLPSSWLLTTLKIPRGFSHVLLVKDGALHTGLSPQHDKREPTDVFGVSVTVYNNDGRYSAQARL